MTTIRLTSKLLHEAATDGYSGWNREQLELLGMSWPMPAGWLRRLVGKDVPLENWEKVMALKGTKRGERAGILAGVPKPTWGGLDGVPPPPYPGSSTPPVPGLDALKAELEAVKLELREIKALLYRAHDEEKTCLD